MYIWKLKKLGGNQPGLTNGILKLFSENQVKFYDWGLGQGV